MVSDRGVRDAVVGRCAQAGIETQSGAQAGFEIQGGLQKGQNDV
ncbi:hypothetical protein [Enterocloster clostridioformis]|nr:hypothetical protein [Enterocloster clostridioformis]